MTPLARLLAARITAGGPLSLADYMADCLMHPTHGYYATRDPFGAAGDFTTAPEISQMFGELAGLALAQCWLDQGRPTRLMLAEIGPGRGTLMADSLRALQAVPDLIAAVEVHLVEASPVLRARQRHTLAGTAVTWHDSIATLPDLPLYLVANEFFDALPIRQFHRRGSGWSELQVGLAAGHLTPGLAPPGPVAALAHRLTGTHEGDVVEICPGLPAIAGQIASRIARSGGVALVIDYGGWQSLGDTFQAVQAHRITDPFAAPGAADLTAHVDFQALAQAFRAGGAAASAMVPQGLFLSRLGIDARAGRLAQGLSGPALASHRAAHQRLTDPAEMGELFKVIACHPVNSPPPPGLDPA